MLFVKTDRGLKPLLVILFRPRLSRIVGGGVLSLPSVVRLVQAPSSFFVGVAGKVRSCFCERCTTVSREDDESLEAMMIQNQSVRERLEFYEYR